MADLWIEYGPPPTDPMKRSAWRHGIELVAQASDHVRGIAKESGTVHRTLDDQFGQFLPELAGEIVWECLRSRRVRDLRAAALVVLRRPLWEEMLAGANAVKRTRIVDRLVDDAKEHLLMLLLTNPVYKQWFTDLDEE